MTLRVVVGCLEKTDRGLRETECRKYIKKIAVIDAIEGFTVVEGYQETASLAVEYLLEDVPS